MGVDWAVTIFVDCQDRLRTYVGQVEKYSVRMRDVAGLIQAPSLSQDLAS
jgi:hypothetical protein